MPEEDSEVLSVAPDGRPSQDQPVWRRDFPLDWPEDEYRSRRAFVAFLMLTSAAFVTRPILDCAHSKLEEGCREASSKGDCFGEPARGRTIKAF
jgi:hypothetical protein